MYILYYDGLFFAECRKMYFVNISGKREGPEKYIKNYMKTTNSVWLRLYMRKNERVQHPSRPLTPAWAVLNFQHFKVLESMIRGNFFWLLHGHYTYSCDALISGKKWSLRSINISKIIWKLQTRFDWVCTWGIIEYPSRSQAKVYDVYPVCFFCMLLI
jgi:hypothetical protein